MNARQTKTGGHFSLGRVCESRAGDTFSIPYLNLRRSVGQPKNLTDGRGWPTLALSYFDGIFVPHLMLPQPQIVILMTVFYAEERK